METMAILHKITHIIRLYVRLYSFNTRMPFHPSYASSNLNDEKYTWKKNEIKKQNILSQASFLS